MAAESRLRDWLFELVVRAISTCRGQYGVSEPGQLLAGVNVLNDRMVQAQERARPGEAAATSSESTRKGHHQRNQEQGTGAFASQCQPQPPDGEDYRQRESVTVFRSFSGRCIGGVADICGAATFNHLELAILKYDLGIDP